MPEIPPELAAQLSDRYRLEQEIGRGGMAVVYQARDLRYDRPVALKIFNAERARKDGAERFRREILLTAKLQHPHILPVLDSGITGHDGADGGQLWYSMPLVEGESLHDRLGREHHLTIDEAIRITREVALALEYAHRQGVVHRDIKPENILLTKDGVTLVADFGIAQALGGIDRLTQQGIVMGSPLYMSPEQTQDQAVDGRSDCYALAAVLFEMLTGLPPFTGSSLHAIAARRVANPQPSAKEERAEVPSRVDGAIRRALALKPKDRFPTVTAFADALVSDSAAYAITGEQRGPTLRSRPALLGAIAAVLVLATWFLMKRPANAPTRDHTNPVVAVLPFDNLGDSSDDYFAEGVADEVRAKLAQLPGLELIARESSVSYRGSGRKPGEIARELDADYLLTGTVRWEKADGRNRVRVTPELIDARGSRAARTRWVQPFDAALTDVFQVQTDIASRVAEALGVALADSTRQLLSESPTVNLAAYDAFLQGEAAAGGMKADQASLRRAIGFYRQAVAQDSTFALAWAELSRALSSLYSNGVPDRAVGNEAHATAERARRLNPREPVGYLALGDFYQGVNPIDNAKALESYEAGLRLAPGSSDLLSASASAQTSLGLWDLAASRLIRVRELDPRSVVVARRLAAVQIFRRDYPSADSAAQAALALAPDNLGIVLMPVMVAAARGDRTRAQTLIHDATRLIDPHVVYPFFALYQDLYWLLDDSAQNLVLAEPPAAFDNDTASWALIRTGIYAARGDTSRARIYADSARLVLRGQSQATPEDAQRRVLLGLSLAYLGRKADAIKEGLRGIELLPIERDGYQGPYVRLQLVRIYLMTGEDEKALDLIEQLLKVPFYVSPGWLTIDPTFDPLRRNPRFRALMAGAPG